jgi:hypothetical protein
MSISQVNFMARRIEDLFNWFVEIYNHLGAANYRNGAWSPVVQNLVAGYPVYAATLTVNTGTLSSGTVASTYVDDGVNLVIAEVTGNPGFSFDLTFTGMVVAGAVFVLHGYYKGNPAHNVKLQIYNYNTTVWDNVTGATNDFPSNTVEQMYQFILPTMTNYVSSGSSKLRIIHTSNGAANQFFYIDKCSIDIVSGSDPTVTGFYQRFGKQCNFSVIIDGAHTTEDSLVNLPIAANGEGVAIVHNLTQDAFIGTASVKNGALYLPNYNVAGEQVVINGNYKVDGI